MKWLKQVVLPGQDNQLLASEPEVLKRKISGMEEEAQSQIPCNLSCTWKSRIPLFQGFSSVTTGGGKFLSIKV